MTSFAELQKLLTRTMLADRHRLRGRLEGIERDAKAGGTVERPLQRLHGDIQRSIARAERRRADMPPITYNEELPVSARKDEIARAIAENQVVIVCGETGSGKSTQLPKICLALGRGTTGMIGHTQPRRIAAQSVAARIAEEMGSPVGRWVGFKIRFADATGPDAYVKVMTDGILLAETQGDRFLEQYDTIIIDEAHERSLNIDFLIGFLKRLLPKRPELKVIITSATIDAARFSQHFCSARGPAPVIEVSGRTYPVEVRYRPLVADDEGGEVDWMTAVADAVDELARIDTGDMLIFMPTERDIHETAKILRGRQLHGPLAARATEILPLYARLPGSEQQRIFKPGGKRRIVIATNVAESSLTVPRIRYVIDPGTARISRYSARSKTQRLPIEPISQASADQRHGRCGRVGPGICVRLYSEEDYAARDRFTSPEIQRSNLASVILQAKALRLGDIERFPFLDPPKPAAIRDGFQTLFELGAVDDRQELTPLGRKLAALPVDPRIGRMILAADEEGCLSEMLIIASALEVRDPRDRPVDKQEAADEAHAKFVHPDSDFFCYLTLWDFYHDLRQKLSRSALRKACRQNFLSFNRVREWTDVHRQLLQLVEQAGLKSHRRQNQYEPIHRAILTGLLANVANIGGAFEYTAAGGSQFQLWPGSSLFSKKPKWVVAAELVETSRRYLRTCGRIKPEWIEPLAEHLVKRTYSEPHWDGSMGAAMVFERVTLFGLTVVPRRRVALGPIDPATARELLIRHGLVEGDLTSQAEFLRHNLDLADEMQRLQKKLRRHDLLRGEWARYQFYDSRLPEEVCDAVRLETWRKEAERANPRLLFFSRSDLVEDEEAAAVEPAAFPDAIDAGGAEFPLEYVFEPGSADDGLNLTVPLEELGRIEPARLEWLVPGLFEQKLAALIKSLPKPLRRSLVPAPDTARQVAAAIRFGEGDLLSVAAKAFGRIAGQVIRPSDFRLDQMPAELRMNIRAIDAEGATIAVGTDLAQVRAMAGDRVAEGLSALDDPRFHRDGLRDWDFDELPERVEVASGGRMLTGYPMLIDGNDSVDLRLSDSPERAAEQTRRGVARLCYFAVENDVRQQVQWLPGLDRMLLYAAPMRDFDLRRELAELIAFRSFSEVDTIPRRRADFERQTQQCRRRIVPAVQEVSTLMPPLWEACHRARLALEEAHSNVWQYAVDDMRAQLDRLVAPGFLTSTPWAWLQHYPRYLRAICARIEGLRGGSVGRDAAGCEDVRARWEAYQQRASQQAGLPADEEQLQRIRWMLEEYRVSLFAQKLGTSLRISGKVLDREWEKLGA